MHVAYVFIPVRSSGDLTTDIYITLLACEHRDQGQSYIGMILRQVNETQIYERWYNFKTLRATFLFNLDEVYGASFHNVVLRSPAQSSNWDLNVKKASGILRKILSELVVRIHPDIEMAGWKLVLFNDEQPQINSRNTNASEAKPKYVFANKYYHDWIKNAESRLIFRFRDRGEFMVMFHLGDQNSEPFCLVTPPSQGSSMNSSTKGLVPWRRSHLKQHPERDSIRISMDGHGFLELPVEGSLDVSFVSIRLRESNLFDYPVFVLTFIPYNNIAPL